MEAPVFEDVIDYSQVRRGKLLGKGAFGSVFKVTYRGMTCAMKQLPEMQGSLNSKMKKVIASLKLEAKTLQSLGYSPYTVSFVGTCEDDKGRMCMLMEYVNGPDLAKLIQDGLSTYKWNIRQKLTMDIALGIDFIHSKDIIHRDIKSDNILVEVEHESLKAKIADFGVCRVTQDMKGLDEGTFLGAGSPLWMAPEIFQKYGVEPSKKTDIYALGVIMWEIASLCRPYSSITDPNRVGYNKQEGIIEPVPPTTPPTYENLLKRCQSPDPQIRPYADEVALILKRAMGLYETNIQYHDANDMDTLFGTRFYEATNINETTALMGAIDENKLVEWLNILETNPDSDETLDRLYEITKIDPSESLGAFYEAIALLYFEGARLGRNYRASFQYYEKAVKHNSVEAMYRLGVMYRFGYGVSESNNPLALYHFKKAAELGSAAALCSLGECYALGLGMDADLPKALNYLELAAQKKFSHAQYLLGYHYYNGDGVEKDYTKAIELYSLASEQNHADAQFSLGIMFKHGIGLAPNDAEALKWFRKAAFQGHARAQNNVGSCYYFGLGAKKDRQEAAGWFKKAAVQNNSAAQHNLGECYANGRGVHQNYDEAFKWFTKAAEQGHPGAQRSVAISYFMGHGTEKNAGLAIEWFTKASEQGNARAQCALAQCYLKGHGTSVDFDQGFKWSKLAAESGQAEGQYMLGSCFFNGTGTVKDYNQAFRWFYSSSEEGHLQATLALAACFRDGLGVGASDEEAFKCYLKLAERGVADAQNNVGTCYSSGKGVNQNLEQAYIWFKKAADSKNPSAMTNLAQCYQTGRGVASDQDEAMKWYNKAADLGSPFAMYNLGACYERGDSAGVINPVTAKHWYQKAALLGFEPAQRRIFELAARKDKMKKSNTYNPNSHSASHSLTASGTNYSHNMLSSSGSLESTQVSNYSIGKESTKLHNSSNSKSGKKKDCKIQ